ncbi:MAG: hypothetical protein E7616_10390 [Ruminococcaceae bacterium]|nr:hypothetical protein [Oscillospiraceae bacterium]
MKTLKALKITSILNSIFCILCIASTVCFAVNHYYNLRDFFSVGMILVYGWIINPVGIVSFFVCLVLFLIERKNQASKQAIGKKWIWIFIWPIVTTVFYITAGGLMVVLTGGV